MRWLLGNALKFTHRGEVKLLVDSLGSGESSRIRFRVIDQGIGIAEEAQSRLFQAFHQADATTTRMYGGTGLGLALSRRLAQEMGGNVVLSRSEAGKGSIFEITIATQLAGVRESVPARPTSGQVLGSSPDVKRLTDLKILVADDSHDNQLLIKRILERYGARVTVVGDGLQAVSAASEESFDVILMDIQMPYLDGYSATRQLKAAGNTTPIIALTAHAMREEEARSREAGCASHLTKPIDIKKLVACIEDFRALSTDQGSSYL